MYEYQCTACEHRFEELVATAEAEALVACPQCGSPKIFKLFSSFSVGAARPGSGRGPGLPPCATGGGCSGNCHG
jgi:putative FmdB family regulatory protein